MYLGRVLGDRISKALGVGTYSTPLVVGQLFTTTLARVGTGEGLPMILMPVPEIHPKA